MGKKHGISMKKYNVNGAQNVEVSQKIPCEKSLSEQLFIMQQYTKTHKEMLSQSKEEREIACLKVLYPKLFRSIEEQDLIAGRIDFLPIGFGCVTSVGGVGHYCVFNKLLALKEKLSNEKDKQAVDELYDYWLSHDLKAEYCEEVLTDTTIGTFVDCNYPMIATARLSGMMLNYNLLLDLGIDGLRKKIENKQQENKNQSFYQATLACLDLFVDCANHLHNMALIQMKQANPTRQKQLARMAEDLLVVQTQKPNTFSQALQLFWLYALLAGVINYGRLDDMLGTYLAHDLDSGILTEQEAYDYCKSLWTIIENRRTTVNGRIIVGGKGRRNPEDADRFLHLALKVAKDCRYVEPQFTLRVNKETSDLIWNEAMDALEVGATYPTIYNDEVNIPAVSYGMRIDEKDAQQYVPFGCTEFVIQGKSTGTPNVCMNLLKIFTCMLNHGIDPMDSKAKNGMLAVHDVSDYATFELLYEDYKKWLDYYMDLSIQAQMHSFEVMNRHVSFLFSSILTDDCIERGKALLDGGVKYLGGTNEIYGLINVSDSLWALKDLVYTRKKYTLQEVADALRNNFEGYELMRKDLWACDKYGNDLDTADDMALDLYHYVAKGVRQRGIDAGMQYFLVVISNNQLNTEWGRTTGASPDGRYKGMYMNPANNPQGGANVNGPTAMLNSLAKFEAKYHAGSVQNIKFTPSFFHENREQIKALFRVYFKKGGSHIMVTVVERGILEDAVKHPERYPDLIVRVSGFSAVFVHLESDVQQEVMSRMLYG